MRVTLSDNVTSSGTSHSPSASRAASDCSDAKRNRPSGSRAITHRTAELQRLQTPSKKMIGWIITSSAPEDIDTSTPADRIPLPQRVGTHVLLPCVGQLSDPPPIGVAKQLDRVNAAVADLAV